MDHQLFLAINGLAGRWPWFDKIGPLIGGDYIMVIMALGIALLWFFKPLKRHVYLAIASAAVADGIVTQALKHLVHRPRPFEVLKVHQLIIDTEHGNSFPSGHATIYFSLAFAFWGTKYFWPLFILAVIGSIGRVVVGVHYPLDILVGAVIGLLTALILKRFFKHHFR